MDTRIAGIFEMSLVFGGPLAFMVWELWSLRRAQRRDREWRGDDRDGPRSR